MTVYVSMTDKFMSGWGAAKGRINKLVIICETWDQAKVIERNARRRPEMRYVNICLNKPYYRNNVLTTWKAFDDLSGPWLAP